MSLNVIPFHLNNLYFRIFKYLVNPFAVLSFLEFKFWTLVHIYVSNELIYLFILQRKLNGKKEENVPSILCKKKKKSTSILECELSVH